MAFTFILAEKPETASKIAHALDDQASPKRLVKGGIPYFEALNQGKTLRVAPAVGHLYTIAPKKRNRSHSVFELDWTPAYKFSRKLVHTRKWIEAIKEVSKGASEYVSATDYDIEGELIGYTTLRFACGGRDRVAKRMVFSTLTTAELQRAFYGIRPHLDYRLVDAGEARHVIDFLWGINVSRALTSALRKSGCPSVNLSTGRVQGPTLGFVVNRDRYIESFTPTPYWAVYATIEFGGDLYRAEYSRARVGSLEEAQQIIRSSIAQEALVKNITFEAHQQAPPAAFSLGELQCEAYRVFGYSPSRTLKAAERLYLDTLISYPRTGSKRIPSTIDCRRILHSLASCPSYEALAQSILRQRSLHPAQDNGDNPAHPAIYPTGNLPNKTLGQHQARLFDLIVRRFLSTFGSPASWRTICISLNINGETFYLRGRSLLSKGWLRYYRPYASDGEVSVPPLEEGKTVTVRDVTFRELLTPLPPRYNLGSLLHEMENEGLGTAATRAGIIDVLFERGYVKGERIEATALGRRVFETLRQYCPELVSIELTRQLEKKMEAIQSGVTTKDQVIKEAREILEKTLTTLRKNEKVISKSLASAVEKEYSQGIQLGRCPVCDNGRLTIIR